MHFLEAIHTEHIFAELFEFASFYSDLHYKNAAIFNPTKPTESYLIHKCTRCIQCMYIYCIYDTSGFCRTFICTFIYLSIITALHYMSCPLQ